MAVFSDAVITSLPRRKLFQKIRGNPRALQQSPIRPGRMSIHPAQENALLLITATAEIGIKSIGMRPELQRQPKNFKNVASHAPTRLLRLGNKRRKFINSVYFLAGI